MSKNILVIKLGALGDFMQALGPMAAIRRHHKKDHMTLLTTKPFQSIADKSGYFDSIALDTRPKWYQIPAWYDLRKTLNAGRFTRVYDLQNNDRTGLYFRLFSPRPEWVGTAKGASHCNMSPERTASLAFYGHVQTLGLAGIDNIEIDTLEWMDSNITQFGLQKPYALIIPGSAPDRPEKRWPVDNFIAVCTSLLQKNVQPVLMGTDSEKEITGQIAAAVPDSCDLTGQTSLTDIVALSRHASLAIGNDTGPMHMIAPTGTHTYVLFTHHSNPVRHAPLGKNVHIFQQEDIKPEDLMTDLNSILENLSVPDQNHHSTRQGKSR